MWLPMFLISTTISACGNGCLICNTSTNACKMCDFQNGYYLNDSGTCSRSVIKDCELYSSDGGCYRCKASTYLAGSLGSYSCNVVPTFITNCSFYSGPTTCSQCATNYALNNNTCTSIPLPITNCEVHSSTGTKCTWCKSGFIKNASQTSCNTITTITNCKKYSLYECEECDSTTIKTPSAYTTYSLSDEGFSTAADTFTKYFYSYADSLSPSACISYSVSNCATYTTFNTCKVCNSGYYLTSSFKCSKNPLNNVLFCYIYQDYNNCKQCMSGYFLESSTKCTALTTVTDCVQYELNSNACSRCIESKILNTDTNSCDVRQNIIANCSLHNSTKEECETCNSSYVLTNMYLNCESEITDCDAYKDPSLSSSGDICTSCVTGKYVNASYNACLVGNKSNCLEYKSVTGDCEICQTGYYYLNGNCTLRNQTLYQCTVYTPDVDGSCNTCSSSTYLYDIVEGCGDINEISNCANYSNVNTCASCNNGFNLKNNQCISISAASNCLVMFNDVCTKCLPNYDLQDDNSCKEIQDIRTYSCSISSASDGVDNQCQTCNQNYVPYSTDGTFVCLDEDVDASVTAIDNCIKTIIDDGSQYCDLCASGYSIGADFTECLQSCPDGYTSVLGYIYINYSGTIPILKYCVNTSSLSSFVNYDKIDTCEVSTFSTVDVDTIECVSCAEGFAPLNTCPNRRVYFSGSVQSAVNIAQNFSPVDCQDPESATVLPNNGNCRVYKQVGSVLLCQECSFGYTGPLVYDSTSQKYYVNCTQEITNCNTDVVYGHLSGDFEDWMIDMFGFTLAQNYSCHQCTGTKIPFIHLSYFNKLLAYDLKSDTTIPSNAGSSGNFVECREPAASTFNLQSGQFNFPSNCALGMLVVDKALSANYSNGTVRCMACKNGFSPVYTNNKYITACQPITNCDTTNTEPGILNSCRYCSNGYSHIFEESESLNYSSCIQVSYPTDGCDFYDSESDVCKICKKGYQFNIDDVCEKLTTICDKQGEVTPIGSSTNGDADIYYSANIYLNSNGKGCYDCPDAKMPFYLTDKGSFYDDLMCVQSQILVSGSIYTGSSYIANCKIYSYETPYICSVCKDGYVRSTDGLNCYSNTNLANCATATNSTTCATCSSSAVKVNGVCIIGNISNCAVHQGGSSLTCSKCASGYVNNTTSCTSGTVTNCDVYDSSGNCTLCSSGYILAYGYCMNLPSETNCSQGSVNTTNNTFSCSTCKTGYLLSNDSTILNDTVCIDFVTTPNCISYNGITCTECSSSYYLNNGSCTLRTVSDANCATYDKLADECDVCNAGYLISSDNKSCEKLIAGIPYCAVYSDDVTCKYCYDNRLVSNNQCVKMTTPVANCSVHSAENVCLTCNDNYFLGGTTTASTCTLITAKNCLTYQTASRCASCNNFFKLVNITSNGSVTRIDCEAFTLANCEFTNSTGTCKYCYYPYYPSGSSCVKGTNDPIPNCKYLRFASSTYYCTRCNTGYVKITTGTSARSCAADSNGLVEHPKCITLGYKNTCTACSEGYYLDSGTCKACTTGTGCSFCTSTSPGTCIMCSKGFTMASDGKCYANSGLQASEEDYQDDKDEKSPILLSWILCVLAVLTIKL